MPVTQDRLTRLREFGLSEYAARSYLALLDLGIAEARDVSSISKVPQAKIYHVLEQLHDKGLVVILPEFPKKYAPVPFEEYLGRIYEEHTRAAGAIEAQRAELAEMFRVMGDTEVGDRGFFTVIRGRRNVLSKIEEMIAATQKELIALATAGTASRLSHMVPELKRARERDVRLRMLAPVETDTLEKLAAVTGLVELRARDLGDEEQSAKVAIVVADSTRAFLIHFVPDDANLNSGKDIGVFTDQEAMVAAIQAIVEPHWSRAATYEQRRAEILHGEIVLEPGDVGIGRVFQVLRDAVVVVGRDERIALWNPAAEATFARPAKEARGMHLDKIIAPDSRDAFAEHLRAFRERGESAPGGDAIEFFETQGLRPNGESFPVEVTLSGLRTVGASQYVIVIARDITARRKAQIAEREGAQRVQRAYEQMTEAFYALDREWRFEYRNPTVRALQGKRTDAQIDGRVIWEAFPELVGTRYETEFKRAMSEGKPVKFEEHYAPMDKTFEVNAYPSAEGLSVYFRDITERKKNEARLAASEARFWVAFRGSPIPIALADPHGHLLEANPAFAERKHANGAKRITDLVGANEQKECESAIVRLANGESATARVGTLHLSAVRDPQGRTTEIIVRVT